MVTLHYMTADGTPVTENGKAAAETVRPSVFGSSYDMVSYFVSGSTQKASVPYGFRYSSASMNSDTSHCRIAVGVSQDGSVPSGKRSTTFGSGSDAATAYFFRDIRYSGGKIQTKTRSASDSYADAPETDGTVNIYVSFLPADALNVTIHSITEDGTQVSSDITKSISSGGSITSSDAPSADRYTLSEIRYGWKSTDHPGTAVSEIAYTKGSQKWSASADGTASENLISEVWAVYRKNESASLTVHYADSSGKQISADSTKEISAPDGTISASSLAPEGYTCTSILVSGKSADSVSFTQDAEKKWSASYTYDGESHTLDAVPAEITAVCEKSSNAIIIHHTDESGNIIAENTVTAITVQPSVFADRWGGYTLNANSSYRNTPDGYTYKAEYLKNVSDDMLVSSGKKVMYYYDTASSLWKTGIGSSASDVKVIYENTEKPVTDVIHTYENTGREFTVHYVQADGSATDKSDTKFTLGEDNSTQDLSEILPESVTAGAKSLTHVSNRLSSIRGRAISAVSLRNGKILFTSESAGSLQKTSDSDSWMYTDTSGRTFTLKKSGSDYSVTDSEAGTVSLNLKSTENSEKTYAGTARDGNVTVRYTITSENEAYSIKTVTEITSASRNIYALYTENTDSGKTLWIDNDLVWTGNLTAGMSSALKKALEAASGIEYSWEKRSGDGEWTAVTRKREYGAWNIAYSKAARTWLDAAADEGKEIWDAESRISYRVTLKATLADGTEYEKVSDAISIDYCGELENGSFETPGVLDSSGKQTNGFTGNQTSNASYKANEGVWQTTGIGTGAKADQDIEVFNINQGNTGLAAWWRSSSATSTSDASAQETPVSADSGSQFAELNCEAAGALYQDVLTHPGTSLSWQLSHRARTMRGNDKVFDSMYLVIMPASTALTAASDGGELNTQSELVSFISSHGGYSSAKAADEENSLVYSSSSEGVLIRKISSDNYDWHTLSGLDEYTARSSVTRFFFVAGATGSGNNTIGNFIDNVSFSQNPPVYDGFSLKVQKTITGLSADQLKTLAGTFSIKLSDAHMNAATGLADEEEANTALNGTRLSYAVSESGGKAVYTAKAEDGSGDEYTQNFSGTANLSDDGSLVLTWTFINQDISSDAADQTFLYRAEETGQEVSGLICRESQTVTPASAKNSLLSLTAEGSSVLFQLTNTYSVSALPNAGGRSALFFAAAGLFAAVTVIAPDAMHLKKRKKKEKTEN